jgi:hypothetical protein
MAASSFAARAEVVLSAMLCDKDESKFELLSRLYSAKYENRTGSQGPISTPEKASVGKLRLFSPISKVTAFFLHVGSSVCVPVIGWFCIRSGIQ